MFIVENSVQQADGNMFIFQQISSGNHGFQLVSIFSQAINSVFPMRKTENESAKRLNRNRWGSGSTVGILLGI